MLLMINTLTGDAAVVIVFNDDQRVYGGDTLMLTCCVQSSEVQVELTYSWNWPNETSFSAGRAYGVNSSVLFITGVEIGDLGKYSCVINFNDTMIESQPVEVYIAGEPYGKWLVIVCVYQ